MDTIKITKSKLKKNIIKMFKKENLTNDEIDTLTTQFFNLNNAIVKGHTVRATIEKQTNSRSKFIIEYVKDNKICVFWLMGLEKKFLGATENKNNWSIRKFTYDSSVIGMSHKLDATDYVFTTLQRLGGSYIQL